MSNNASSTSPYSGLPPLPPHIIVFGPKANCTLDLCPIEYSVYGYQPNLAANVCFAVIFAIAGIIHTILGVRWRTWFFMGCMLLGCVSAVIGYIERILMHYNPFNFAAFMLQITCVSTAPVYYCAAIYVTLAAFISHFSPSLSRFRPKLLYWVFIPCDLCSLCVQAIGGGLSTLSNGQSVIGIDLALVGLAFQVFTIVVFCALFADYLLRYLRNTDFERDNLAARGNGSMNRVLGAKLNVFFGFLALAILLITTRCAYRLAELNQGYYGNLVKEEPLFIGCEGVLVVVSVFCLMLGHPGLVFRSDSQGRPLMDERYELVRHEGPSQLDVKR